MLESLICALMCVAPEPLSPLPVVTESAERMAVWRDCMAIVDERSANAGLMTYIRERSTDDLGNLLAKLITTPVVASPSAPTKTEANDFPGGVAAVYTFPGAEVRCEYTPLMVGVSADPRSGALLYRVQSTPKQAVTLAIGGGRELSHHASRAYMRGLELTPEGDTAEILPDGLGVIRTVREGAVLVARADGANIAPGAAPGALLATFPDGAGWVLFTFSADETLALDTSMALNPLDERAAVDAYYETLLAESSITTPDPVLNGAFKAAIINMEYCWYERPYGWIECVHHWLSMYHQEHTAAAEWLGQEDRARKTILSVTGFLDKDGFVESPYPSGKGRIVYGGTQHFFTRQARHYWEQTADKTFPEEVLPSLKTVIRSTFDRYDPDDDGLLSWGAQVGNQEDYIAHPGASATATAEGAYMLDTGWLLATALGDQSFAQECQARMDRTLTALKSRLWDRSLGRFVYFEDGLGTTHLDGQYHAQIGPFLFDFLSPAEGWSAMRHVRDRLMQDDGRLYVGNNFILHGSGPGIQGNAVQQPWAAFALAKLGLRNEACMPLQLTAGWVMNEFFRGSWMEHAGDYWDQGYFSPPAALYIQAMIEAIYGLKMNRPQEEITISPSFPDAWETASLNLPGLSVSYTHESGVMSYLLTTKETLVRSIQWRLPMCVVNSVMVNGQSTTYDLSPSVNGMLLAFKTPASVETRIEVATMPIPFAIKVPASLAEGETFQAIPEGGVITGMEDPCGAVESFTVNADGSASCRLAAHILRPYQGYGPLGLLNFGRRSFFLHGKTTTGAPFTHPVDMAILPRFEAVADNALTLSKDGIGARLRIRNNTATPMNATAYLEAFGTSVSQTIAVPPRSEVVYPLLFNGVLAERLLPGENPARLILGNGAALDLRLLADESTFTADTGHPFTVKPLHLPEPEFIPADRWKEVKKLHTGEHEPFASIMTPLRGLGDTAVAEGLPGVSFPTPGSRMIPISWRFGKESLRIPLDGLQCRAVYLLVLAMLDNHDSFAPAARVTLEDAGGTITSRVLYFPGDLHGYINEPAPWLSTLPPHTRPFPALLDLLPESRADWPEGKPRNMDAEGFPQRRLWTSAPAVRVPSGVLTVIQVSLREDASYKSLTLSTEGVESALGLVSGVYIER